jgi:hypothetical protein
MLRMANLTNPADSSGGEATGPGEEAMVRGGRGS